MSILQLSLLGPPEVHWAGRPVTFRTRKALALLIYLGVQRRQQPREHLAHLLWLDNDDAHARAALRTTLGLLRQTLRQNMLVEDSLAEEAGGWSNLFVSERDAAGRDCLRLSDGRVTVTSDLDVVSQAASLVRASGRLGHRSVPARDNFSLVGDEVVPALQRALAAYRGKFLSGFDLEDAPAFADWVDVQRAYWHQQIEQMFDCLAQVQLNSGEGEAAADTAQCWVALSPLNERAHQTLIQAHMIAGDRAAALATYEAWRTALAAELRIEPAPETVALAERVRGGDDAQVPVLRRPPAHLERLDAVGRPDAPPWEPTDLAHLQTPLVGRTAELRSLAGAYRLASQGSTQVMVLEGEIGVGKTRVAEEFFCWATTQGADLLQGQAIETIACLPYHPLIEALRRRVDRENAPDDLLDDVWLAELARLLPELRVRYPDLLPRGDGNDAEGRTAMFEAVARLVQALADRHPVVLFIDDLHWADTATLDLLQYCAHRWAAERVPLLLLLTVRSEALAVTPRAAEWQAELERKIDVSHLVLNPLRLTDIEKMLAALTTGARTTRGTVPLPPRLKRFGAWLLAQTDGLPFYLTQTLRALSERGALTLRPTSSNIPRLSLSPDAEHAFEGLMPTGVRELIRTKLNWLTPAAGALAAAGAVLGQRFTFEQLCAVAKLEEDKALAALDDLLRQRVLREAGPEAQMLPGTYYVFAHEKFREVAYAEAAPARRRVFHRRAFAALHAAGAPPAQLARQALAADLPDLAFQFSVAAGDTSLHLFAAQDALVHYEQAWALLVQHQANERLDATHSTSELRQLHQHLDQARQLAAEWAEAAPVYDRMLAYAQVWQQSGTRSATLESLAAESSSQLVRPQNVGPPLRMAPDAFESSAATMQAPDVPASRVPPDHQLSRASSAPALESPDAHRSRSTNGLPASAWRMPRWDDTLLIAEQARALHASRGDRKQEAHCLFLMSGAKLYQGQIPAAIDDARAARALSLQSGNLEDRAEDDLHLGYSDYHLALGLLTAGQFEEARAVAQEGLAAIGAWATSWDIAAS
jgi:DNA-binding SARP family transcriptional activator